MIVDRQTADGLSRQVWHFNFSYDHGLRLTLYGEQTRKTKRHKWTGYSWEHDRERSSGLKRPTSIPGDVIGDALALVHLQIDRLPVYIGWFNESHRMPERDQ